MPLRHPKLGPGDPGAATKDVGLTVVTIYPDA